MNERFIVNNKFTVDPVRQVITAKAVETKIEPRIMTVLIELCRHQGKVVYRKDLIEKVWENYGGADEALSQSISKLRKILQDEDKEIIETIPKKGYVFHGIVEFDTSSTNRDLRGFETNRTNTRKYLLVMVIAILAVILIFPITEMFKGKESNQVDYDQLDTLLENYHNTIITITPDSVRYKLTVIGDQRPLLYINDSLLTPRQMEDHLPMVNILKKELRKRNISAE
jgi:DNA-binding winged helix-turn-helix (wHTH) protein